jgi:hypothetical protein
LSRLIVDAMSGVYELSVRLDGTPGLDTDDEDEELAVVLEEVLPQAAATRAPTATRLSWLSLRTLWDPWPPVICCTRI